MPNTSPEPLLDRDGLRKVPGLIDVEPTELRDPVREKLERQDREDGLETAQAIRTSHRDTQVLILSGVADPLVLSKAIDFGVAGIIRKDLQRIGDEVIQQALLGVAQ